MSADRSGVRQTPSRRSSESQMSDEGKGRAHGVGVLPAKSPRCPGCGEDIVQCERCRRTFLLREATTGNAPTRSGGISAPAAAEGSRASSGEPRKPSALPLEDGLIAAAKVFRRVATDQALTDYQATEQIVRAYLAVDFPLGEARQGERDKWPNERERAVQIAEAVRLTAPRPSADISVSYTEGWQDAADEIERRIRALPREGEG